MMDVLEEHLDEAAFLWSQWERALRSPSYDLAETSELEERLLAHLDGLVVGGEVAAAELLLPALETSDSERISSAAFALLAGTGKRELEETLAVFDGGDAVQRSGVARALELSEREGLDAALRKRLTAEDPSLRTLAFEVLSFRGAVPTETRTEWLHRDSPAQVIAALRDPRPLPKELAQGILSALLVDPRPGVREAAFMAGLLAGVRAAWKACRKIAEEGGAGRRQCLLVVAMGAEERDVEWMVGLLRDEKLRPDVLWALGFSGQPRAAEACLEWMGDGKVAALAGEAFSAITGLKVEKAYQWLPPREPESLVPLEQEDLNANLVPGPEESLPVPLREAVEGWWRQARKDFERGARYLRGRKLGAGELLEALRTEPMRRRSALALEVAIRGKGASPLQTRALTNRQRDELSLMLMGRVSPSMSPFAKLFGI